MSVFAAYRMASTSSDEDEKPKAAGKSEPKKEKKEKKEKKDKKEKAVEPIGGASVVGQSAAERARERR